MTYRPTQPNESSDLDLIFEIAFLAAILVACLFAFLLGFGSAALLAAWAGFPL